MHVVEVVGARGAGQHRAVAHTTADGVLIVLADGAGGTANGAQAAQAVTDTVLSAAEGGQDWVRVLAQLDRDEVLLHGGQATAVVVVVTADGLDGASVGDSGAWVIRGTEIGDGTLLVASDGLLKYAKPADIARIAGGADLQAVAQELVALVRLRSGALQDDVSIVVCRGRR
jgi:serine/threonine protein phosphatase PrpC